MEKIKDYALIGNGRSAALISKKGSLDWLCWPRFDSPSFFEKILDADHGGFWKIFPVKECEIKRDYIEETNVLQTYFQTKEGKVRLTDFMTILSDEGLQPQHELIREIECLEGEVEFEFHYQPKSNYGQTNVHLFYRKNIGVCFEFRRFFLILSSPIDLKLSQNSAIACFRLKQGEKLAFFLTISDEGPAVLPILEKASSKKEKTCQFWKTWAQGCQYEGIYRKEVIRSALVLKLLAFCPTGAFIAAPTTSLPERIGGDLNWDYRFCWIRDAAFTVSALFSLGYKKEAESFVSWLLHATRLNLPELRVLYDVYGRNPGKEMTLSYLSGYFGSNPVRIKNAAKGQMQLDCYGEVVEAVYTFVKEGGKLDRDIKKMLRLFGLYVCKHWQEKDHGIWEIREEKKDYTYSKLMCWVTLDRLVKLNENRWLKKKILQRFEDNRDQLRKEIEKKGWNETLKTYTDTFDGHEVDSTSLLFALYDFEKIDSPNIQQTFHRIKERLYLATNGLLFRGERFKAMEGSFMMCSFWVPLFLAKGGGSLDEAKEIFSKLINLSNDLGLYSEEIDPISLEALGNFPQAFTHIALINAALAITEREKKR